MKTSETDRAYEDLGFKPNMKYGPRSDLRKECSRFLRFAYLLDFVTMDALTNIYLNSVQFLFSKLESLSNVEIKYEFDASKSQFGESKRPIYTGPDPLFFVDAELNEEKFRPSDLVEVKVKAFRPPPIGHSTSKDFDIIVHIELEEEQEDDNEDNNILEESDEESKYHVRYIWPNIHKLWIKLNPSKLSFIELLDGSINQGYNSLKSVERWSRHGELYAKVLESWDDKVWDEWGPPDENHLDCDTWLEGEELRINQSAKIHYYIDKAFEASSEYIKQFKPYLQMYYDNLNINYDIVMDERLKNPQEVIPELLKLINKQIDDFDNYLPESKDLGLLRIDFSKIKQKLKPNPKDVFDRLRKELPLAIKRRILNKKQWLNDRIDSITSTVIDVDQFVKQVQALEFIDKHFQKVKDEIDLYQNLQRICQQNGISISKEDIKLMSEMFQIMSSLSQEVMSSTENIDSKKKSNIENIKKKIPVFSKEVQTFRTKLQNPRFLDIKSDLGQVLEEMKEISKEWQALVATSKKFQEWQSTLDMEINQFVDVDEVKREVTDRISLWSAIRDWQLKVNDWISAPFESIDTESITIEAEKYTKIVIRWERGLPDNSSAVK